MTQSIEPYQEERPWGNFRRFTQNSQSTVKIITVNPGATLSLQSHEGRAEFWHVLKGAGAVEIDGVKTLVNSDLKPGEEFFIPAGAKHRLSAADDSSLEILEVATGEFDENDIVRYQDRYGRA